MQPLSSARQIDGARREAYMFFAALVEQGMCAELVDTVRQVPALAAALQDPSEPDDEAARHFELFEMQVHPYQGVFTHPKGDLDALRLARRYRELGPSAPPGLSPDHLAAELRYLSRAREPAVFIADELLRWLPALQVAVRRESSPFWTAVFSLLVDVVLEHAQALGVEAPAEESEDPQVAWLDAPDTGMRQIADFLLTPARSGAYLSRSAIARVAGELPRGFGSRSLELRNLLSSAVDFNGLGGVIDRLEHEISAWSAELRDSAAASPVAAGFIAPWLRRLDRTSAVVARLRAALP